MGFFLFKLLDGLDNNLAFFLALFFVAQLDQLSVFNLFDNDGVPLALLLFFRALELLILLYLLEPLDFHHQVFTLLLFLLVFMDVLLFFELLVADGHTLGIHDHLIEVLDIIFIIIADFLGTLHQAVFDNSLLLLSLG